MPTRMRKKARASSEGRRRGAAERGEGRKSRKGRHFFPNIRSESARGHARIDQKSLEEVAAQCSREASNESKVVRSYYD